MPATLVWYETQQNMNQCKEYVFEKSKYVVFGKTKPKMPQHILPPFHIIQVVLTFYVYSKNYYASRRAKTIYTLEWRKCCFSQEKGKEKL